MELQVGAVPPPLLLLLLEELTCPELLPLIPELLPVMIPEPLPLLPLLEPEMLPLLEVDPTFPPELEPELLVLPTLPLLPELGPAPDPPPFEPVAGLTAEPELEPPPPLDVVGVEVGAAPGLALAAGGVPSVGRTACCSVPPNGPPSGLLSVPPHAAMIEPEASAAMTAPVERRPIDRSRAIHSQDFM